MDVTELSMLLESLDCHEVSVAEIESAVSASSQLLNLDSNQKLLLYALYKQFLVGDVNIPEPDKKDLMASSKWQMWKSLEGFPKNSAAMAYVYIVNELTSGNDQLGIFDSMDPKSDSMAGLGSTSISTLSEGDNKTIVPWSASEKLFKLTVDDDLELLRQVIADGADVNSSSDHGMRPIHFAADRGHFEVVQLLAAAGAQIDCQDDAGMTPLMYAASCDHLATAELLVTTLGASRDIRGMIDPDDLSAEMKAILLIHRIKLTVSIESKSQLSSLLQ